MTFADLQPGDVLMKDDIPYWLVLRCSHRDNVFVYLALHGRRNGQIYDINLSAMSLWYDRTFLVTDYDGVQRGGDFLPITRDHVSTGKGTVSS